MSVLRRKLLPEVSKEYDNVPLYPENGGKYFIRAIGTQLPKFTALCLLEFNKSKLKKTEWLAPFADYAQSTAS
jgi:hypothetical protein